jgi:protease IV
MAAPRERSLLRRIVGGIFAWFGFVVAVLFVLAVILRFAFAPGGVAIGSNSVISVDLTESPPDRAPTPMLQRLLFGAKPTLIETEDAIYQAASDPRVKGMVARVGEGLNFAEVEELRDAVAAFRANGKFAYAYADAIGELSSGMSGYYLATAFDQIWVQPYSTVGLAGLRAETPFFRGTLDKIGVEPRLDHREEFKSAMNMFSDTKMTAPQREETDALLQSLFGQAVRGIADRRQMKEQDVRALIDRGPFSEQEALAAHLIDHVGYRDDAIDAAKTKAGTSDAPIALDKYAEALGGAHVSGPTVAIIYADGLIQRGDSSDNPLSGGGAVGADTLARAFRQAAADKDVRAIVMRIDSPGGSATASETIWQASLRAKKAGKPFIVSMGNVAGSGGYYIAAAADKIVADPATLTGSIGVVGGKILINGLSEKLGVSWDSDQIGTNAGLFSPIEDFTPEGHDRFERYLDQVYDGFKDRVAQGRKLDAAKVEDVAKGRVWSGEDAQKRGLVDTLGGFEVAIAVAKQQSGIPADSDVTLKQFPSESRAPWTKLLASFKTETLLASLAPWLRTLVLATAPPGALTMAPLQIR